VIEETYSIRNETIERVTVMKTLGVWLDHKLNYKIHLDKTIAKTNSILSLIKRFGREFNDIMTIKMLYSSLVLSIIDYGSIVWMPKFKCDINRLESNQKQFLLFSLRNLGWQDRFQLPPYEQRLGLLDMTTIHDRHKMHCAIFVVDALNDKIDSAVIKSKLIVRGNQHGLRHHRFLEEKLVRTNYHANAAIPRCISIFNELLPYFNLDDSKNVIKFKLKTKCRNDLK
jgi:hypothetical protein